MVRWVVLGMLLCVISFRIHDYVNILKRYKPGQKVEISTVITNTPFYKNEGWSQQFTGIKVFFPPEYQFRQGERIRLTGTLEERVTENKNGYLSLKIEKIDRLGDSQSLKVLMSKVRYKTINRIMNWLPGDEGALAAGILVGGDEIMSLSGVKAFRQAGIAHVAAASGYNVTVVTQGVLTAATWFLGRAVAMWFVIVFIIMYVFVAGSSASVVRAGLMAVIVTVGKIRGREADSGWMLLISSLLMLAVKPEWWFDIGFQLSVAATAGIIIAGGNNLIRQILAAYLATLPLLLHYFGNLSVLSPIANLLLIWPVPVVTPVLAVAVIVGSVWRAGGGILALLTWPELRLMTRGAEYFSGIGGDGITINNMSWGWVAGYYGGLLGLVMIRKWRLSKG